MNVDNAEERRHHQVVEQTLQRIDGHIAEVARMIAATNAIIRTLMNNNNPKTTKGVKK